MARKNGYCQGGADVKAKGEQSRKGSESSPFPRRRQRRIRGDRRHFAGTHELHPLSLIVTKKRLYALLDLVSEWRESNGAAFAQ